MKYDVVIEPIAQNDLTEIFGYISSTLHEEESARNVYNAIKNEMLSLENMPFRYPTIDEEPYRTMGVKCAPVKNYLIFYMASEKDAAVYILRITYNRREWKNLL